MKPIFVNIGRYENQPLWVNVNHILAVWIGPYEMTNIRFAGAAPQGVPPILSRDEIMERISAALEANNA